MVRPCLQRCPECKFTDADKIWPVPGDGNRNAEVMLVYEQPGKYENNLRRPMMGKSGDELSKTYIPLAGLSRDDIWLDNTVKCKHADSGEAPPDHIIKSCSEFHLKQTLESINPHVLVLCGGVANSLLGLDVDTVHGTGRMAKLWGWEGKVFSLYHVALGIHKSSAMQALLDDFKKLRMFIGGELQPARDKYPNPAYYKLTTAGDVDSILSGWEEETLLAVDTESSKSWRGYQPTIKYVPWCATFCIQPGEAYMVKVENRKAMLRFLYYLLRFRKLAFHNLPHDASTIEKTARILGADWFKFPWDRCEDTMSQVYIDARFSRKGLKPVSYQLLGAEMKNFDDVVTPYGRKIAIEYFNMAMSIQWPDPVQEATGEKVIKKCGDCKGKGFYSIGRGKLRQVHDCNICSSTGVVEVEKMTRKQSITQKIKRLLTDLAKNPELDVWERWQNWGIQVQPLIDKIGPVPLASVEQVPEDEILDYAGADAHSTWRIRPILKNRLVGIRRLHCG